MRTAEGRDQMVARVKVAFANFPKFAALPEVKADSGALVAELKPPADEASYVAALHEICANGEPLGRDGHAIVGRRIDPEEPIASGKRLKAEPGR